MYSIYNIYNVFWLGMKQLSKLYNILEIPILEGGQVQDRGKHF